MALKPKNTVLREVTKQYLSTINKQNPPSPAVIEEALLDEIDSAFELQHNAVAPPGKKWHVPDTLPFPVIADILYYLYDICRISCAGANADSEYDLLAIYQTSGENEGIYLTSEDTFRQIAREYNYHLTGSDFTEIMRALHDMAPRRTRTNDRDLIAVGNGIFNYKTKTLEPFSPDKIFLSKSHVNYNPSATNITIHNDDDGTDWDVESWMNELSDDPEIVNVLWEILGAILRPHVRWNKSAWLFSETGNNGKGTLCELMRSLLGTGSYASISISDFAKDFMLEPLIRATAVIVDENDVGGYIDKAANLKAAITNDVLQINRKFKAPIAYQFYGFMVQCLNEFPRLRDKSDSFYRRQLFIPFDKCFTGKERRYIKSDYLHRTDVLEYVLYKVLNMDYYTLSEPASCKDVLSEYKEFNDPVRQFWSELKDAFVWDLLPFDFLYSLYTAWMRQNMPSGGIQGKNTFITDIINAVNPAEDGWFCKGRKTRIRTGNLMDSPETLIARYDLEPWKNKLYHGMDINKISMPSLATMYRGLIRIPAGVDPSTLTIDTADEEA